MNESDARIGAEVLVASDLWGIHSHGTKSLRWYLARARAGGLNAKGKPRVIQEGPAWAVMDGDNALAMVSSCRAMDVAIAKAAQSGIGFVTMKNGGHFGAAGYYALMAVKHDMIGLAMSNSDPNMSVPGGRGKIIGNNPVAYAVPAGVERPLVLDIALSAVAAGKVSDAAAQGRRVPDNWIVDEEGLPTTDPALYPFKACLVPMAGHKGYGLALLVEILTAAMSGGKSLREVTSWNVGDLAIPTGHGQAFIGLNVGAMAPIAEFKARVDSVIREIRAAPKAKGAERIYAPGEKEWEKREDALAHGLALPERVLASLRGLAEDLGMTVEPWLS